MSYHLLPLINDADLAAARRELGPALPRILGYYRHDGVVAINAIERAMQNLNATAMVLPAHSMKGESRQLGAERLAELARHIETTARRCIEERTNLPEALDVDVRQLRVIFHESITQLERIVGPDEGPRATPRALVPPPLQQAPSAPIPQYRPVAPSSLRPVFGRRGTS